MRTGAASATTARRLQGSGTKVMPDGIVTVLLVVGLALASVTARAELRGHGGPVRALAVAPDGRTAISGSFDQSAILWALDRGAALDVLRFHEGAVNAAAALPDGRFVTGGEDGRIVVWQVGQPKPTRVFAAHAGPIAGLAVAPDGRHVASASWDATARVVPLGGGEPRVLSGHQGNVNAVAFLPDGRPVTAGYDGTLRIWPNGAEAGPLVVRLPTPLNAVVAAPDGEIVTAGADGVVRILRPDGVVRAEAEAQPLPVIALALSPDGRLVAAATMGGSVAMIERASGRVSLTLAGPGLPVWSVAFRPDGSELLTGGSDRVVRRWNPQTGRQVGPVIPSPAADPLAAFQGERGAEVFRACVACHTLTPDGGNRAGPTLHGVFGRRIATAPGYNFSEALKGMDIVWTAQTIAKLFEVGPSTFTPGTKMPEQTIADPDDRDALVRFLEKTTRPQ